MSNPLAHVAKRLSDNKEKILQHWENSVRAAIPESQNRDKAAIRNSLPTLIEKMAQTLSQSPPKSTAALEIELSIAKEHGEQRATFENYSMQQVIREYQLLRETILAVLEEKEPLSREDRDVILDAISLGEQIAASAFHQLHLESIRNLKTRTDERDEAQKQRDVSRIEVSDLISERGLREAFVSGLAHDLRTPLTAARMNLELLFKRRSNVGSLELHAGRALGELSRLEKMIQDLLDANRIKAGLKLPIKVTHFNLVEEVEHTLDSLASLHGDRFEFEAPAPIEGYWDKKAIRRIVENLCVNALKYGEKTMPITVSVKSDPSHQQVELRVHNWGAPIPLADQKSIFDQFRRSSSEVTNSNPGWGIGLAIVRGMAEAHGGSVKVQSTAKGGTVFTVVIPLDVRMELLRVS
jgi:signal transduction histidine kinase